MIKVVHRRICPCGETENLIKSSHYYTKNHTKSGERLIKRQYYKCKPCNARTLNAYYHSLTGEKKARFIARANGKKYK